MKPTYDYLASQLFLHNHNLSDLGDIGGIAPDATGDLLTWNNVSSVWERNSYNITDYYTKTESGNTFVNVTGDIMTGNLIMGATGATSLITGDSSTFTGGIGSWVAWYGTAVLTASGGKGIYTGNASGGGYYIVLTTTVIAGRQYTFTATGRLTSGTYGILALASGASGSVTFTGTESTQTVTFTATSGVIGIVVGSNSVLELDNITLQEAYQGDFVTNGYFRAFGATTGLHPLNTTGDIQWGALLTSTADNSVRATYGTTGTKLLVYGAGDSTNGLMSVQSASTNAQGTLARFGYYSYWNMDSSGNTYWNWGARYNGTTGAWVRDYVNADNYLPYIQYGTTGIIGIGGATSNDKTSLAPTMSNKFTFNVTATDPLATFNGRLLVDGVADQIQLRVQAHSTQTNNLQTWESSSGTVLSAVTGTGNVGIGTTTISNTFGNTNKLQVAGNVQSSGIVSMNLQNATNSSSGFTVFKRGATGDATATLANNAEIGYNQFYGYDGNATANTNGYARGAFMLAKTTEAWSTTAHGTKFSIFTTDNGSVTNTENLTILQNGNVGVGIEVATARLQVNGKASSITQILRDNATTPGNIEEHQNSSGTVYNSFGATGAVFNEDGVATRDFRVESDTETNMIFVDSNADTDGALYLGGATNGTKIGKGIRPVLLGTARYERHIQIDAVVNGNPANSPAAVDFYTAGGLQYLTTGTKYAYCQFEIPDDWDGGNIYFEVDWFPDSGAISGTDTIKWNIEYRAIAEGELINNGTSVTVSVTDSADYAQYQTKHTRFTLAFNNANQPLTVQDHVYFKISRDTGVANDFGGSVTVSAYEIIYTSTGFPTSN